MNEGGHSLDIFGFGLDAGFGSGAGVGTGTGRTDLSLRARCYGNRLGGGVEFEVAADKFIVGPLVLEEDDFTESLGTGLKSDRSFDGS